MSKTVNNINHSEGSTPLVSVCMITYNHERYLAQALGSVLEQEADFPIEIVIGEDCSTDKTREILNKYVREYPQLFRTIIRPQNVGFRKNFVETFLACRGKYIALLEGDDFWVHKDKLAEQVQYMNDNPDIVMCYHNANTVNEHGIQGPPSIPDSMPNATWDIYDLIKYSRAITCTSLYRNGYIKEFPHWFFKCYGCDWPLQVIQAQYGNVEYINEKWSTYRKHSGGFWQSLDEMTQYEHYINYYYVLSRFYRGEGRELAQHILAQNTLHYSGVLAKHGEIAKARKWLLLGLIYGRSSIKAPTKPRIKALAKLIAPWAVKTVKQIRNKSAKS